jgi:formylmethanofuran dehydrogenase subunit E
MTMCGLRLLGINDPKGEDRKKLLVFVEIDRCATDAIMALTGCRPGKRNMKVKDYGKMAATFINLESGKAVRVASARKKGEDVDHATVADEELFRVTPVNVPLKPEDLPGKPLRDCQCARCGETILDGREIETAGETLCRPCLENANYYEANV